MLKYNLCKIVEDIPICNPEWSPRYTCKYYVKSVLDDCRYRIGTRCHHAIAIREMIEGSRSLNQRGK